jgi:hypothetical protein
MSGGVLAKYNEAKRALTAAVNIDEVKDIRDKAVALRTYAMQARDRALIDQATEIRLRAERRAGELLAQMEKNKGAAGSGGPGRGKKNPVASRDRVLGAPPKLADLGVNKSQSSRWQRLAGVPADDFEEFIASAQQKACAAVDHAQQPKPDRKAKPPKPGKQKATRKQPSPKPADVVAACIAEIAPILRAAMPHIVRAQRVPDLAIELKKTLRATIDEVMQRNTEADDWTTTHGEENDERQS